MARGAGVASCRIGESLDATGAAMAAGTAEAIVDITSTGATLTANHLRILDDGLSLKSEANLAATRAAAWGAEAVAAGAAIGGALGYESPPIQFALLPSQ